MILNNVHSLLNDIQLLITQQTIILDERLKNRLVYFSHDLELYIKHYDKYPQRLHMGWGAVITNYLTWMFDHFHAIPAIKDLYNKYAPRIDKIEKVDTIKFSQRTINSHFALHDSVNKSDFQFRGMALMDVANTLKQSPELADCITVRVIWHEKEKCWVAINNRGYATLCLADIKPLRILPDLPTTEESNRFNIKEEVQLPKLSLFTNNEKVLFDHFKSLLIQEERPPCNIITAEKDGEPVFTVTSLSHRFISDKTNRNEERPYALGYKQ